MAVPAEPAATLIVPVVSAVYIRVMTPPAPAPPPEAFPVPPALPPLPPAAVMVPLPLFIVWVPRKIAPPPPPPPPPPARSSC